MKIFFLKKKKLYIILLNFIIFLDYYIKSLILKNFAINQIKVISLNINILYVKNYGLIFGLFSVIKIFQNKYLFIIYFSIIFLLIFKIYKLIIKNTKNNFSLILIVSGSIGNLIDRIKYGYIIDFIDFHYKSLHFPIFNISDFSISIGIIIYVLKILNSKKF
ncbi:MAG: signal peptidase II [Buchnera aphidicola (Periphyllus acericola)]|uniref:signal peptidase II n=1 Tax=Buchnera aphidicola TaxID=9 RepID=UPI0030D13E97|nr:signal peptidase II [Buchnera aphidicola (Periphyllus acericola)]